MNAAPRPRPGLRAVLAAALAFLAGCGGPPPNTVRGTVTLDGRPLGAGRLVFEAGGRAYPGLIGADGSYELRAHGAAGVVPGTYAVTVLPPEPELVTDPKTAQIRQVNPPDPKQYPERYRDAATSGITKTVAPGDSTLDIELSSK